MPEQTEPDPWLDPPPPVDTPVGASDAAPAPSSSIRQEDAPVKTKKKKKGSRSGNAYVDGKQSIDDVATCEPCTPCTAAPLPEPEIPGLCIHCGMQNDMPRQTCELCDNPLQPSTPPAHSTSLAATDFSAAVSSMDKDPKEQLVHDTDKPYPPALAPAFERNRRDEPVPAFRRMELPAAPCEQVPSTMPGLLLLLLCCVIIYLIIINATAFLQGSSPAHPPTGMHTAYVASRKWWKTSWLRKNLAAAPVEDADQFWTLLGVLLITLVFFVGRKNGEQRSAQLPNAAGLRVLPAPVSTCSGGRDAQDGKDWLQDLLREAAMEEWLDKLRDLGLTSVKMLQELTEPDLVTIGMPLLHRRSLLKLAKQQQVSPAVPKAMVVPPEGFLCPITGEMFAEPVMCSDGHTYEFRAIHHWLFQQGKNTSPLTNERLKSKELQPNHKLREAIEGWTKEHAG